MSTVFPFFFKIIFFPNYFNMLAFKIFYALLRFNPGKAASGVFSLPETQPVSLPACRAGHRQGHFPFSGPAFGVSASTFTFRTCCFEGVPGRPKAAFLRPLSSRSPREALERPWLRLF
jgi:hypothetical protein